MLQFRSVGRLSVGVQSPLWKNGVMVVSYRGYAKPKAAAKGGGGGKGGKPKKEVPKATYRGPLDFSWWKKVENPNNAIHQLQEKGGKEDVLREFADRLSPGKQKLTKELYSKYVTENMSRLLRKPTIELDDDFEFFYDPKATYDIHAEPRMIGGKYGCKKLRDDGIIPCVITGKRYPDFAVQIKRKAFSEFLDNDQDERLADGKKFNLVIEGRRYLVTPRDILHDPVTLDPKFVQWYRLCDPRPVEKIRPVPKSIKAGGPPQRFPWMCHPHMSFEKKEKPWRSQERLEERKKRRDMHIHEYLGIPR